MPPLPLAPNVFQVTTFGTLHGKPCDHVVNWELLPGAFTLTSAIQALAQADATNFMGQFDTYFAPSYVHVKSVCKYLGSLTNVPFEQAAGTAGSNIFGNRVPAQDCITIRHKSPRRGKGLDGRTNLAGPDISDVSATDGESLAGTLITNINGRWTAYVAAMSASITTALGTGVTTRVCILHRKFGTYDIPLSSLCDPALNTHRRWAKRLARH